MRLPAAKAGSLENYAQVPLTHPNLPVCKQAGSETPLTKALLALERLTSNKGALAAPPFAGFYESTQKGALFFQFLNIGKVWYMKTTSHFTLFIYL